MKQNEAGQGATETVVLEHESVYAALCDKINLMPVAEARPIEAFRDNDTLSEASADERVARGMDALLNLIARKASRSIAWTSRCWIFTSGSSTAKSAVNSTPSCTRLTSRRSKGAGAG